MVFFVYTNTGIYSALRRCIMSTAKREGEIACLLRGEKLLSAFPRNCFLRPSKSPRSDTNRCDIIRFALQTYVRAQQENRLERALIEGYTANAEFARRTAEDCAFVDSELA